VRAVIDTNVLVSAIISGRRSASRLVLLLALDGKIAAWRPETRAGVAQIVSAMAWCTEGAGDP
jgi:hypothetical protein